MSSQLPNAFRTTVINKVPAVSLGFWVIKILSTTVGETGADYLAVDVGIGIWLTTFLMAIGLALALFFQLRKPCYIPWAYWLAVVLISVEGTLITDILTDELDVSLYTSTAIFSIGLAAIFMFWFYREHSLSIREIFTRRRELFYWTAILCTFALGTAAGDLATEAIGLGFRLGLMVFSAMLAVTAIAFWFGANEVACFWVAYILTRPLGASLGDLLSQAHRYGGLGFGAESTSIIFLIAIVSLVTIAQYQSNQSAQSAKHV